MQTGQLEDFKNGGREGCLVVQSVKPLTLDFGSGQDLAVHEFELHVSSLS